MYPNQGYPGQFPPYGAGMPQPGMPQPFGAGMAQPFGAGMPMPQPGISQPAMPNYGIPGYGPPEAQSYGQAPAMPSYGSPNPAPYGQPNPAPYGQPNPAPYGQPNPAPYGQPNPAPYGQPAATPAFGSAPPMQQNFGQPAMPNYSQQSPPSVYPQIPNQQGGYQGGNYGMPPQQEQMVQAHQYTASYSQPTQAVRRGRPVITPNPNFDAANDAAALRKAMKGFGTDEDGLINVLCRRTCDERVQIARAFKTAYGKDLVDDLRSETSGNFQKVMVALTMPKNEYYCRELFEAMNGAGTDEDVLIEVMCTMSNQEIREIGFMYQRMYGVTLESQLRSDTSGSMKRLMTSLSVGGRDESMRTDINSARADAESLKRAGVGRWGTDESEFNRVLCLRNYEQLKLVCQEYEKLTGNSLEKDIKREFSGDIEDALLAIVRVANNRPEFFARRLHKSMAGLGTNDRDLIRLCVTRSEIDMVDVKEEFQRYYSKSLKSFIKGDTSGHYKHALYALCGENRS